MSKRSDAAWRLAAMLADEAGVPVEAEWQPGRGWGRRPLPHGTTGRWVFRWADGPTVAAMRTRAEELLAVSGLVAPLRKAALEWERNYTDRAAALAVLDLARDGKLADDREERHWAARNAVEIDLYNTAYPTDRPVEALIGADVLNAAAGGYGAAHDMADLLAERGRDELGIDAWPAPLAPGEPLRGRWVWGAWPVDGLRTRIIERRPRPTPQPAPAPEATEPGNETADVVASPPTPDAAPAGSCPVCGGPLPARDRGRPARYCSARCRLRAHRAQQPTERRNETAPCATCGRPVELAATGRRRRYCSARCRRKAWQDRHNGGARYVLAYSAVDGWCLHADDDPVPRDVAGPDIGVGEVEAAQRWAAELLAGDVDGWTETACPYGGDQAAYETEIRQPNLPIQGRAPR